MKIDLTLNSPDAGKMNIGREAVISKSVFSFQYVSAERRQPCVGVYGCCLTNGGKKVLM